MSEHPSIPGFESAQAHQDLVLSALLGEIPADDAGLQSLRENCPTCRIQLDEHASIGNVLNAAGDLEMEAVLAEALAVDDFPGDERGDAILRDLANNQGRRYPWVPILAAAAAVFLTLAVNMSLESGVQEFPSATHLGSAGQEELALTESNELRLLVVSNGVATITWDATLPAGCVFAAEIFDESDLAEDNPLLDHRSRKTEWKLSETELKELPERFRVTVHAQDGRGRPLGLVHSSLYLAAN